MQKIEYPLIVSDFDGTLVRTDGTVSLETKQTIRQYIQDGGKFAISTGRMPKSIISQAKELGLTGVVCCSQGSVIVDIETEDVLLEGRVPNETAIKICEKMESLGLHIHVYDLWEYYSNMDDEPLKMYESIIKQKAKLVVDKPMSVFLKETKMAPFKVLAMVTPEDNARILTALENEHFEDCYTTRSSVFLVEVGNVNYSKGTSVEFLANFYNIPIKKTIAVGDQLNDLSMIELAGLGIAVQNADEELKKQAFAFEYTNEEDAVAKIIKRYGYKES